MVTGDSMDGIAVSAEANSLEDANGAIGTERSDPIASRKLPKRSWCDGDGVAKGEARAWTLRLVRATMRQNAKKRRTAAIALEGGAGGGFFWFGRSRVSTSRIPVSQSVSCA